MVLLVVLPQPIYMNSDSVCGDRKLALDEDDLKTPTVEELSFPGQKSVNA